MALPSASRSARVSCGRRVSVFGSMSGGRGAALCCADEAPVNNKPANTKAILFGGMQSSLLVRSKFLGSGKLRALASSTQRRADRKNAASRTLARDIARCVRRLCRPGEIHDERCDENGLAPQRAQLLIEVGSDRVDRLEVIDPRPRHVQIARIAKQGVSLASRELMPHRTAPDVHNGRDFRRVAVAPNDEYAVGVELLGIDLVEGGPVVACCFEPMQPHFRSRLPEYFSRRSRFRCRAPGFNAVSYRRPHARTECKFRASSLVRAGSCTELADIHAVRPAGPRNSRAVPSHGPSGSCELQKLETRIASLTS